MRHFVSQRLDCQDKQRDSYPCADHHAQPAPGGVDGEAEWIGPVLNDGMLRRHSVSQHCCYQHHRQCEHEFDGDPLSKSSLAGRSHIRVLIE
jgi:hypothetical protein